MNTWKEIPGWFGEADALVYQRLATMVQDAPVVEIGCWEGKSTASVAGILRTNRCVMFAVDTWAGSPENKMHGEDLSYLFGAFKRNMAHFGFLGSPVVPIQRSSLEAAAAIANLGIRPKLVFIDGDHEFNAVYADILAWASVMHPDGVIAGHDYGTTWIGVVGAVTKLCPKAVTGEEGSVVWHTKVKDVILP